MSKVCVSGGQVPLRTLFLAADLQLYLRWTFVELRMPSPSHRTNLPRLGCIPSWYRFGMSRQIAVRLPDDLVAFVDDLVSHGDATSRAAVVSRALERERRRKVAERDAVILASAGTDTDLDRLAEFAAATSMDDLD